MPVDINEQFNTGMRFIRQTKRSNENWNGKTSEVFSLLRGIVIGIFNNTAQSDNSHLVPPYSLNVRIIGEDVTTENAEGIKNAPKKWYAPLFPIQMMILPEVGEEVLIMREFNSPMAIGYWVCRVNESAYVDRELAREWADNEIPQFRYGFPFEVGDLSASETLRTPDENNLSMRIKPGDVIIQGRTKTFSLHTYDENGGKLTQGITDNLRVNTYEDNVDKLTENTHVLDGSLSGVSNLRSIDETPGVTNIKTSTIFNRAGQHITVSSEEDSETNLFRHVLGENLLLLMDEIISSISANSASIEELAARLAVHTHETKDTPFKYIMIYPTKSGNVARTIKTKIDGQTTSIASRREAEQSIVDSQELINKINLFKESLSLLSKHNYLN